MLRGNARSPAPHRGTREAASRPSGAESGEVMGQHLASRLLRSSERRALALTVLLSGAGVGVASYLLTLHAAIAGNPRRGLCTFNDTLSCDAVLASPYAEIAGLPVALLGLVGFAFLLGLAAWRLWIPDVTEATKRLHALTEKGRVACLRRDGLLFYRAEGPTWARRSSSIGARGGRARKA